MLNEHDIEDMRPDEATVMHSTCGCRTCIREMDRVNPIDPIFTREASQMIVCKTCGNKRCPHANDHRNACTGSNEPGQPGSAYPKSEA